MIDRVFKVAESFFPLVPKLMTLCAAIVSLLVVLLVCAETVVRYCKLFTMAIAEEYTGYALVFITVFAGASALLSGTFIRLRVVLQRLGERTQEMLTTFGYIVGFLVVTIYFWESTRLFLQSVQYHTTSTSYLYTPLAIPQSTMPIGFGVLAITLVVLSIKGIINLTKGRKPVV